MHDVDALLVGVERRGVAQRFRQQLVLVQRLGCRKGAAQAFKIALLKPQGDADGPGLPQLLGQKAAFVEGGGGEARLQPRLGRGQVDGRLGQG